MRDFYMNKLKKMVEENKKWLSEKGLPRLSRYDKLQRFFSRNTLIISNTEVFVDTLESYKNASKTIEEKIKCRKMLAEYYTYQILDFQLNEMERKEKCIEFVVDNRDVFNKYFDIQLLTALMVVKHCCDNTFSEEEVEKINSFLYKQQGKYEENIELDNKIQELRYILDPDMNERKLIILFSSKLSELLSEIERYENRLIDGGMNN